MSVFTQTVFLCRTLWDDGDLGLDGGTTTDPRDVLEWIVDCDQNGRSVRVDRIDYDAETGAPECIRDVTDDMRNKLREAA